MRKQSCAFLLLIAFGIGYVVGIKNWLHEYDCAIRWMPYGLCTVYKYNQVKLDQIKASNK